MTSRSTLEDKEKVVDLVRLGSLLNLFFRRDGTEENDPEVENSK